MGKLFKEQPQKGKLGTNKNIGSCQSSGERFSIALKLSSIGSSESPKHLIRAYQIIFEIAKHNILVKKGGDKDENQG